jgi:MFS transporter, SHS family, lactate transporter
VWAYIFVVVFIGPEMTQEEREEEAAVTLEFEAMRAQGVSLQEIGAGRAKKIDSTEEVVDEKKGEVPRVGHIEDA